MGTRVTLAAALFATLAACGGAVAPSGSPLPNAAGRSQGAMCRILNNSRDAKFNELRGISKDGRIAGYDGTGEGYVIQSPYRVRDYRYLNDPGAERTSATGEDVERNTVGFYREGGVVRAFLVTAEGVWTNFGSQWKVYEFLDINDVGGIVGFYADEYGADRAFGPNGLLDPPGSSSAVAAGINDRNEIAGYFTTSSNSRRAFLLKGATYTEFSYPGAVSSEALGIDGRGEVAGEYADRSGATHGFVVRNVTTSPEWTSFDMPGSSGLTVITGINDRGTFVGYYRDAAGKTNGFLCE
jgi:hypothetical protein